MGSRQNTTAVDAALQRLTVLTDVALDGADGVSVTVERNGRMTTVASSNDTVLRMDDHQYQTGEGPCLAAAAEGHSFHIESLANEERWQAFVPLAIDEGIASILSTPLMSDERSIGALNIYSNTDRAFGVHQHELASLFATVVSGILADGGLDATDQQMAIRIVSALSAREIIAVAKGVMMARDLLTLDEAAAALRRTARAAGSTVLQHATTHAAFATDNTEQTT